MYKDNVLNTNIPKYWIEREYVDKLRSIQEIAFDLKVDSQVVRNILCGYGIPIRDKHNKKHLIIDKHWLIEEYVKKQRSTIDIAQELNCGYNTINRRLRDYGIVVRTKKEKQPNFVGKTFSKWTILSKSESSSNEQILECKCECGEIKLLSLEQLFSENNCSCVEVKESNDIVAPFYWASIQFGAEKRNIKFDITKDYVEELYENQGRKCALTGMRLNMADTYSNWREGKQTASLDRIDSLLDYTVGNVQWVHKTVNLAKWDMPQDEFIKICNLVSNLHPLNVNSESAIPLIEIDDESTTSEWDSSFSKWIKNNINNKVIC